MTETIEETIYGKYVFSEDEKKELASDLTKKINERNRVADEKKSAMSSFKADIDKIDSEINKLSADYEHGYEYKNIDCEVHFDFDKSVKGYYRKDNQELILTRSMTDEDRQTKMEM